MKKMKIIAGPCQHESLEQSLEIATECKRVCDSHGVQYIFKASYDKANRTHNNGKRGVGMHTTMEALAEIKKISQYQNAHRRTLCRRD